MHSVLKYRVKSKSPKSSTQVDFLGGMGAYHAGVFWRPIAAIAWLGALGLWGSAAYARPGGVWAADDGRKIGRYEKPQAGEVGGPVNLFGMRNETVSFQVVVPAGSSVEEGGVSLTIEGLEAVRPEVFREDYVKIFEHSHGLVWQPGSAAEPARLLGMVPDRLVPLESLQSHLSRPGVSVEVGQNQVFWIDLWIVPDAKAGGYTGQVRVVADGECSTGCELQVGLEVLGRLMPDEKRAKSMVWFSASDLSDDRVWARYFSDPERATPAEKAALRLRHYQLAHKHHISLIGQQNAVDDEARILLSGKAFTEEYGYRGSAQGQGLDVLALHAYGGEVTEGEAQSAIAAVEGFPDLRDLFVYVFDEPDAARFAEVNRRTMVSRPMRSFVTTEYTPDLFADIFAATPALYTQKNTEQARADGRQMWIYNGERPYSGSFALDDVAIATRVNPWIQYLRGIPRWFYWEATYYYDFQGRRGAIDVGSEGANFSNRHGDRVNGDGLLMYPGRDYLFPESDVGVDGPVPSIRLKNWRRGIEDVEYLVMARAAGFSVEVDALLSALLPRVLEDVQAGEAVSYPEGGATWTLARRYLFELLRDGHSAIDVRTLSRLQPKGHWRWLRGRSFLVLGALFLLGVVLVLVLFRKRVRQRNLLE